MREAEVLQRYVVLCGQSWNLIPFEVAVDLFYSQENMIRLKESVAQMEATGGTMTETGMMELGNRKG